MLLGLGAIVVFLSVLGGYAALGASLHVLWQPFEVVIIVGAAVGALLIGNPKEILRDFMKNMRTAFSGTKYRKEDFKDLLSFLYVIFRLMKNKGPIAIESHIDKPQESALFKAFPKILNDEEATHFICDVLRLVSMGTEDPHQMNDLIEKELETAHAEHSRIPTALQTMADGLPALGIVAAVLGVIKTMGSINESPEVLGKLIGAAFVGTFLGIFLAYGFIGPLSTNLKNILEMDHQYFACIRAGLVAYLQGAAPAVAVEFARKSLFTAVRPSFEELETTLNQVPNIR